MCVCVREKERGEIERSRGDREKRGENVESGRDEQQIEGERWRMRS